MKGCFHGGRLFDIIGDDFSSLDKLSNAIAADVLDAWFPPAPKVLKALRKNLGWLSRTSPPPSNRNIMELLSKEYHIEPKHMVIGSGSSDLIYRVLPRLLDERGALIVKPAYGEYEYVTMDCLGHDVYDFCTRQDGYDLDVERLLENISELNPSAVVLVNPCNPTGKVFRKDELLYLIDNMPKTTHLIIDETYSEYDHRMNSMVDEVSKRENLIIFKSLSKTFALSGLRAGVCFLPEKIATPLQKMTPPYIIGTPAQVALFETFKNIDYYFKKIKETKANKEYFIDLIKRKTLNIKSISSDINCVLIDLSFMENGAQSLKEYLKERNIFVRNIDNQSSEQAGNVLRVSVLGKKMMKRIASEISAWEKQFEVSREAHV